MVTYKVVVTPMAQNSLRRISSRIEQEASAEMAVKVRRAIGKTIKSLARFPESHEKEHYLCDGQQIYRRVLKWDYRIIYSINDEKLIVSVVEITHSNRSQESIERRVKG
ncbi:MAG: type II toxin-antitoxin system RelE/ParE family toxin [Lewinellaceae bacterium]|nr:type II toxin-antitoxin system RelE/ParE family toxin [Lewinellaceae bacterium]